MKSVLMPSVTVVAVALMLQAAAVVVAPRFAPAPQPTGAGDAGGELLRTGPGLTIPGLASALGNPSPTPTSTLGPAHSENPIPTAVLAASEEPDTDEPDSSPIATVPTEGPELAAALRAFVGVSAKRVAPGGTLTYRYVATNTGNGSFRGRITVSTHAPAGTLRCSSDLGGQCVVPGDYSGDSKQPNESHVNPEPVSRDVTIRPGEKRVLFRMTVQVSPAAADGLVLHNHAHVDTSRKAPTTIDAPNVRVDSGG